MVFMTCTCQVPLHRYIFAHVHVQSCLFHQTSVIALLLLLHCTDLAMFQNMRPLTCLSWREAGDAMLLLPRWVRPAIVPYSNPGPSLPLPPACLFALFARPKPFGTAYWCCVRLFVCYLQSLFEEFTGRALSLLADRVTSLSPAIETCYYVFISAFTSLQER
jgi:hypothetical protein